MPCNSLHVCIDDIRSAVNIPVLSIAEETRKYLESKQYKHAGLISTSATIANRVYEQELDKAEIKFGAPYDLQRAKMDKIIQRFIEGRHLNNERELIIEVVDDLIDNGVDCVALACTDRQLLLPNSEKVEVF